MTTTRTSREMLPTQAQSSVATSITDHSRGDLAKLAAVQQDPLSMRVQRPGNGVLVIRTSGTLDAAARPRFAELLHQRLCGTARTMVVDLSAITFADTAGLEPVLRAAQRAQAERTTFALISNAIVDRLMQLMGIAGKLSCVSSISEVLSTSEWLSEPPV